MSQHSVVHTTFTLERSYPALIDEVFRAWSDPQIKVRWFPGNPDDYEMDFRPGGIERNRAVRGSKRITWETLFREIVPGERIVYTSVLREDETVVTASLTTVELATEGEGTKLVLVEAGAFLDGRERPEWRQQGTRDWLDALGRFLVEGKA